MMLLLTLMSACGSADEFGEIVTLPLSGEASELEYSNTNLELTEEVSYDCSNCGDDCGKLLDSFSGVEAYSNGSCTGGSGEGPYQCVEFVDRVHPVTMSHSGAAETYDDTTKPRKMNMRFFENGNGAYPPFPGDIVVSNGGNLGHVAIISESGRDAVVIMDQNWDRDDATRAVQRNKTSLAAMDGKSNNYPISGWLRPGWDFTDDIDTVTAIYGWSIRNATITSVDSTSPTAVTLNPSKDPSITSPGNLQLDPTLYETVKIRMKSKAPDGNVQVFFNTSEDPAWSEQQSVAATVRNDGTWQTVTVSMWPNNNWANGGQVHQIRVDPAGNGDSGSSDLVSLDAIWFEL